MAIDKKKIARVQGYVPVAMKRRMDRIARVAPYYSMSVQVQMALEARTPIMEDRVGIKEGGR